REQIFTPLASRLWRKKSDSAIVGNIRLFTNAICDLSKSVKRGVEATYVHDTHCFPRWYWKFVQGIFSAIQAKDLPVNVDDVHLQSRRSVFWPTSGGLDTSLHNRFLRRIGCKAFPVRSYHSILSLHQQGWGWLPLSLQYFLQKAAVFLWAPWVE